MMDGMGAMYRNPAFAVDDQAELEALVAEIGAAHVVTHGDDGFTSTLVPLVRSVRADGRIVLQGHVARANPHWRSIGPDGTDALAIFAGPDTYISPSLYVGKATDPRVVPTWNYVQVQARGRLRVHDDADWVRDLVGRLTDHNEAARSLPWAVEDAPDDYVASRARAIVGIELEVERMEGTRKLSQNKPEEDQVSVVAALASGTSRERSVAGAMAAIAEEGAS